MSVVQRCPNCGTTKATPGECEACHEAQVRYFCTDHTPGRWLDGSTCPKCGARFGESTRRAPAPADAIPVATRSPARAPTREPAATATPTLTPPPPPYSRAGAFRASTGGLDDRERLPPFADEELVTAPSGLAPWQKILGALVRARLHRTAAPDRIPPAPFVGGCLMRLMLLVVLMVVGLAAVLFLGGQALLGGWSPY